MRVLLRNRPTGLYYPGRTPSARPKDSVGGAPQPREFGNVANATKFILEEHLPDMEIVLRGGWQEADNTLPVLPEWWLVQTRALRPLGEAA